MRILGIDYGEKRIGLSVSDFEHTTALSLTTLDAPEVLSRLNQIIHEYEISQIVLGWPKNLKNQTGPAAQKVEKFAQRLKTQFKLPVVLWDERLSTTQAHQMLKHIKHAKRKSVVDQMAAVHILQSYLDYQKQNKP